ncbi:MAG: TPR end-of-group domain-containing protein [Planctomycetota bacterium]
MSRRLWIGLVLALAVARSATAAAPDRAGLRERLKASQDAMREGLELLRAGEHAGALAELDKADKLVPNHPVIQYNRACALSLLGKTGAALDALAAAIARGYADHEHMQKDPDLAAVRDTERFRELVATAEKKAKGLRPLVHVPTGYRNDGEASYPLFVTLHGAGGSPKPMLRIARRALGEANAFVLAPHGSSRAGPGHTWNSADLRKVPAEIERLKKKYRIGHVYLHGFSAGGHVGYVLVLQSPDLFDGFIPMAGALRRRHAKQLDLGRAKGLPIFAIQGTKDPVVPLKAAERSLEVLRKHGALSRIHKHPGGHTGPKDLGKVLREAVEWIDEQNGADDGGEASPAASEAD